MKTWRVVVIAGASTVLTYGLVMGALRLRWQDNSQLNTEQWVLRQRLPQEKGFSRVATLPADTQTWVDGTTRKNQRYCYMIVAVAQTERSYSNVACGKDDGLAGLDGLRLRFAGVGGQLDLIVDE